MELQELFKQSISALTLNKLRTGLATLGIVIGIGSVIALMSLGEASSASVKAQIQSIGSNLLTVSPGSQSSGGIRSASNVETLTYDDAKALANASSLTAVKTISPEYSGRSQITAGKNNTNTSIMGVTPTYVLVKKITMSSGTFISESDVSGMRKVAVLGPTVVTDLFGENTDPLGKSIRIAGQSLIVVGVTAAKGGSGFQNQDNVVYVPLTTAQKQLFGTDYLTSISVEATSEEVMTDAQNQVGYFLLSKHKLTDPTTADFSILSQSDILSAATQITGTLTALLSGVAAISLLVGGIGIMNIMLVTVTERTREIGLRKALGAKRKIIITQFLIESVILTVSGGILGIILGIGISYGGSSLMGLPFTVSFSSIFLAVGVSGLIGIIFGWYPAQKAAKLQPIEALRYE